MKLAENIGLKIADALEFPLTKASLQNSISTFNIKTLEEIVNLNLHDFGIFLELEPDEEHQAKLEENIQVALKSGGIDLEDAIDLRQIKNLKLANQMLKVKRKVKEEKEQANQQANIQAQAAAQADAAEKTAMSEVQKQQAISGANVEYEKAKSEFEKDRMQLQAQLDQQKLVAEHKNAMELKGLEVKGMEEKENMIEDRKDNRSRMEATQQSELIDQRKNDLLPKNFEEELPAPSM
ncbi:hypothetical protein HOK09_00155 [Candidatus Woesearchaeota archaeon]|nr:hypothetical protein [Candidatus Woesearchaeota archaeon]